jgi:hypothetical protein
MLPANLPLSTMEKQPEAILAGRQWPSTSAPAGTGGPW